MKTTRKKVKVIGTKEYIDPQTGTIEPMQVISMEDRDFNFHKIWLQHVVQSFDLIGNQKTRLAFWLIAEMDSENKICYTLRQMADKSGISLETVRVTVKALIDGEFLIKQNQGVYRVHPERVFKGGGASRMNVLLQYNTLKIENQQKPVETHLEDHGQIVLPLDAGAKQVDEGKPICAQCGAELIERTNRRTGDKFMGCPNWKTHQQAVGE